MFRRYNSNPYVPRTQLAPSENRSLEERGWKDGDRGGSARTQGIHRKEEKKTRHSPAFSWKALSRLEAVRVHANHSWFFGYFASFIKFHVYADYGNI